MFSGKRVDPGSAVLLAAFSGVSGEQLLDLGCGYGVLGIVLARVFDMPVTLVDVNERAARLARRNLKENGVSGRVSSGDLYDPVRGEQFHHIVTNPPLRAGKDLVHQMVVKAPPHLVQRGSLWMVVRTRQGALPLKERMLEVFGNVEEARKGSGYRVLRSVKGD